MPYLGAGWGGSRAAPAPWDHPAAEGRVGGLRANPWAETLGKRGARTTFLKPHDGNEPVWGAGGSRPGE